jgi:hypothetical protein
VRNPCKLARDCDEMWLVTHKCHTACALGDEFRQVVQLESFGEECVSARNDVERSGNDRGRFTAAAGW